MDNDVINDNYDHVNQFIFYTAVNIPGKGCDLNDFDTQICTNCECQNECNDPETCKCLKQFGKNYENKMLVNEKLFKDGCVTECNNGCSCIVNKCENRIVQFGPSPYLKIKYFEGKNYGLVSEKPILKGQFVCEYAGEVISEEEASARSKGDNFNYIFKLKEFSNDISREFIVDATYIANIGRYINHSCNPNCKIVPVRDNSFIPRLAIFAQRNINTNEEITYSYSGLNFTRGIDTSSDKLKLCLCGSSNCMKYLPYEI